MNSDKINRMHDYVQDYFRRGPGNGKDDAAYKRSNPNRFRLDFMI